MSQERGLNGFNSSRLVCHCNQTVIHQRNSKMTGMGAKNASSNTPTFRDGQIFLTTRHIRGPKAAAGAWNSPPLDLLA